MFNSAYGEFRIKDAQFDFSKSRLEGPSISLIGNGTVGFLTHALDLQFFTRARSQCAGAQADRRRAPGGAGSRSASVGRTENPVVTQQTQLPIVSPRIQAV